MMHLYALKSSAIRACKSAAIFLTCLLFTVKMFAQPIVTSFTPVSASEGAAVTIKGTHFTGATGVRFGTVAAASFVVTTDSTITAVTGAGASGYVRVTTPAGRDSLAGFSYILASPPPAYPNIRYYYPHSAGMGDTVRIVGNHLFGLQAVEFGNVVARFTVLSDTLLYAIVGTGASGYVLVRSFVADSLPGFTFTTAVPPAAPVLHSFFPDSARTGDTVRITGVHFTGLQSVLFGGTAARSFNITSDSLVVAIVGTGSSGQVKVTGPGGSDSLAGFRFIPAPPPPAPVLHSFFPDSAGTGDTVRITGIHFTGALSVTFGGVTARSYAVISDSLVVAIVGTGASGYVTVRVSGSDSLGGFKYITPPPVTPPTPPVAGFQLLQFSGSLSANQPVLVWKARNENSVAYYIVEQSIDSSGFAAVTSITPKIQDTGTKTYVFTDPAPRTGVNYYRLNIKDTAGHSTYSGIVTFQLMGAPPVLSFYPNPASNGSITVAVPATTAPSKFQLVDMSGNIIKTIPVQQGVPQVKINIGNGMKGLYKLIWSDGVNYSYQTVLMMR